MGNRRRMAWAAAAGGVVAALGLAVWLARPTPLRHAFDQITFGQDEADVVRFVTTLGGVPGDGMEDTGELVSQDWEGVVDGARQTFRMDWNWNPERDGPWPEFFQKSLWV